MRADATVRTELLVRLSHRFEPSTLGSSPVAEPSTRGCCGCSQRSSNLEARAPHGSTGPGVAASARAAPGPQPGEGVGEGRQGLRQGAAALVPRISFDEDSQARAPASDRHRRCSRYRRRTRLSDRDSYSPSSSSPAAPTSRNARCRTDATSRRGMRPRRSQYIWDAGPGCESHAPRADLFGRAGLMSEI